MSTIPQTGGKKETATLCSHRDAPFRFLSRRNSPWSPEDGSHGHCISAVLLGSNPILKLLPANESAQWGGTLGLARPFLTNHGLL